MKKIIIPIVLLLLYACDDYTEKSSNTGGGDIDVAMNISVYDNDGTYLGHATSATVSTITILNDSGYMFTLYYDGSFYYQTIYYAENNYQGGAYINYWPGAVPYPKAIFYCYRTGGILKVALNDDGTVIAESPRHYDSHTDYEHYPTASGTLDYAVKIVTTSRSACGIPHSIVGPLVMDFDE